MKYEDKFPLIDSYLMNRISDEESQELTELLKLPEFQEEFAFRKQLTSGIKSRGRAHLKNRFTSLEKKGKIRRLGMWWSIAAAIAILLIALPFLFDARGGEHLYAEYYTKLPNKVALVTRGLEEEKDNDLIVPFVHYQKEEYSLAQAKFSELVDEHPEIQIYRGIVEMEQKNFEQALPYLQNVAADEENRFSTEAKWYLSLAYLALDDLANVRVHLASISDQNSIYFQKAQALLEELD